jgi:hypothetical protein
MQHDCVIVPGLGGFISQYKPAVEDVPGKKLLPPSRIISFNRQLQQNDGMLIQHISAKTEIPYKTAEEKVEQFVKACKHQLSARGIIVIPEVGKLYTDQNGNLNFAPNTGRNYLPEAYGLQPVSWYKVYVDKLVEALKEEDEPAVVTVRPETDAIKTKRKRRYRSGVITSFAIIVVLMVLIAQGIYIKPLQLNTLSLFSFDTVMPMVDVPVAVNKTATNLKAGNQHAPTLMPEMEITRFHNTNADEGYYLILGSFNSIEKAERYKQRQQLDNELTILDSGAGNYRIATYVTANTTQALATLHQFRMQYRPDVWLLYSYK